MNRCKPPLQASRLIISGSPYGVAMANPSDSHGDGAARPVSPSVTIESAQRAAVREVIARDRAQLHRQLAEWVAIPSISTNREHTEDVRASASWLAATLRVAGFPTVEVWETPGHPAVFAEWPADEPDAVTALVYGHHDVQPVEPLEAWTHPPFSPTIVDDELRGRGAADDKGQIAFHLLGLRAHLAATQRTSPAVNLKVLIEGEEESGSPHFGALLREHRAQLGCDVIVISDTTTFGPDTPSVCTAMRGLVNGQLDVYGPDVDLHSGLFGGAVANPAHGLARLLADMHDDAGRVTLAGFYDAVVPLSEAERASFAQLPFDEAAWLGEAARSRAAVGEEGFSTLERIGARPTFEVNGVWSGHTGAGDKTIIPQSAHAKFSFRLVANQEPETIQQLFINHVRDATPAGLRSEVRFSGPGVRPCRTAIDHPANQALVRAVRGAFEADVLFTREGGSGPEADLAQILAPAPLVFLGMALPDDGFHAPNERVRLAMLDKGAEAAAYLWSELAVTELG